MTQQPTSSSLDTSANGPDSRRTFVTRDLTKVSALGIEEQCVNVIIDFTDPPDRWQLLDHGYRVGADIVVWRGEDVLAVPVSALFRHGEAWAVFVPADGRARRRQVVIGHRNSQAAEVLEGLEGGEQVVLYPSDRISDGAAVRMTKNPMQEPDRAVFMHAGWIS